MRCISWPYLSSRPAAPPMLCPMAWRQLFGFVAILGVLGASGYVAVDKAQTGKGRHRCRRLLLILC